MRKNGQKVLKNRMKKDSKATRIVTVICLCWAAFVALVPLVWLTFQLQKRSDGTPGIYASGIYLSGRIYFYLP